MNPSKIQTLRGLTCLLLVVYHVIGGTDLQGLRIGDGWLRQWTDGLSAFRMPMFGLIAGAMYGLSHKRGWDLVRNKAQRLLLPMLSVGTVFALIQIAVPYSNARIADLHLLHIVPVAHFWFLESLFVIFCVLALAESKLPIVDARSWAVYFSVSVCFYLMNPGIVWFSLIGVTYLLPYFLLGVGMTRLNWDAQQQNRSSGILRIVFGAALVTVLMLQGKGLERFSLGMLGAGLLLASGFWSLGWRNALLSRIGIYSFSIYLFHVFFTSATRMSLHAMSVQDDVLILVVSVPVGVIGPVLTQHMIAKSKVVSQVVMGSSQTTQAVA
jgi:surface polysaccharide O-acyltransferase-like enzyme